MFLLLLLVVLIVSVTAFFKLAIKLGQAERTPSGVLDLDTIPRPILEKEILARADPEDLFV